MENLLKKLPFYDKPWFGFLRFLISHFIADNCQQKAASLTYTTLLSIVPILTVLLMIFSTVPALESVREQLYNVIYTNLLPQSSVQVSKYINEFTEKSTGLSAVGAMVLFVTTILTLITIERAFNQIWRVEKRSGGLKSIMRYWTIITLGPLVFGTAFIVSGTIQSLTFLNYQIGGYGIDWSFWVQVVTTIVTVCGFIGMYWFVPKAHVPFKSAAIAGIIVAVIFELLKHVFGTVMTNFTSYEAIYGAFAALPIFLLWIYLSWNLILLGVEISYTVTIFGTKEVYPRHPLLSLLDMLNLVYSRYQKGESVTEDELRDVLGRKEMPKWFTYINYLKDSNLITTTDDDEYVLKKDLSHMTLWDFYRTLPYPLPIKDELDQLDPDYNEPWLDLLAKRFINTEGYAKQELNVPLALIFENSDPRHKVDNPDIKHKSEHHKSHDGFHRIRSNSADNRQNSISPSNAIADNNADYDNDKVIAEEAEPPKSAEDYHDPNNTKSDTLHSSYTDGSYHTESSIAHSKTQPIKKVTQAPPASTPHKGKSGILSAIKKRFKKKPLITNADNPEDDHSS